jgi:hypothetical protein
VQDDARAALEHYLDDDVLGRPLPRDGYRVEREDDGRALLSYDVAGRTRIAFVAAEDVRDDTGDEGWGLEAWAQCDPSELPPAVTEALGIEVWEDAAGARVPVSEVRSFAGPEHCDWQDITFLEVGSPQRSHQYVRDADGELADWLMTTFSAQASLPDGATDTGYRRAGRQLWTTPEGDAAFLVDVTDPRDVERWPRAADPIGCA